MFCFIVDIIQLLTKPVTDTSSNIYHSIIDTKRNRIVLYKSNGIYTESFKLNNRLVVLTQNLRLKC